MKSKLVLSVSLLAIAFSVESTVTPAAEAAKAATATSAAAATAAAATPAAAATAAAATPAAAAKAGLFSGFSGKVSALRAKLPAATFKNAGIATVVTTAVAGGSYLAYEKYKEYNKPEVKPLTYVEQAQEAVKNAYNAVKNNPVKSVTAAAVVAAVLAVVYNGLEDSNVVAA